MYKLNDVKDKTKKYLKLYNLMNVSNAGHENCKLKDRSICC